ncbi:MarR family winged helix-turn-helix transcriptional regulator [Dyella acidiphila]|uniref:MarR family transcriptional regulator n=1 Tax=Dyella acidiphila TaxID=2775866 RepID=A0ABR9GDS0_9GAMM|nr:MarR family transcriptional regulator [Dyella acidiphila]MBE1162198.1 MarR family transcriptional regulator [Dyella acidiphila]
MTDWNLFTNPAPLVNMAARSFAWLGEQRVKPLGFRIGQLPVLYLLREGGQLSQKDLSQHAKVEQPSMAQTLARMERDGWIERSPDPEDGRSSLVSLTRNAKARLPKLRQALDADREQVLAGFSKQEAATLVHLLQRLNQNLDRMVEERSAP